MKRAAILFVTSFIYFSCYSQSQIWGTGSMGGNYDAGIVFNTDGSGNSCTTQHTFFKKEGMKPENTCLVETSSGIFLGMTTEGGFNNNGVLFQYNAVTNEYLVKYEFDGINGSNPKGSLLKGSDGKLYGLTNQGGTNNQGVLFQYDLSTETLDKKVDFDLSITGGFPEGSLIEATDGKIYGMTNLGGINGAGVLFQYDPVLNTYTNKVDFDNVQSGYMPSGGLVLGNDGKLYGTTQRGGTNNEGVLFQYDIVTSLLTKKRNFDFSTGAVPKGRLVLALNGKLYGMTHAGGANNLGVVFEYDPSSNTYANKLDFDGMNNGSYPNGSLVEGVDGLLYGMTQLGGQNNLGVIFKFNTTNSNYTKILDFVEVEYGSKPMGSLLLAMNGTFYGMTQQGGVNSDSGVLFELNPSTMTFNKKIDFSERPNGSYPIGNLVQAPNGMLYGVTGNGGAYNCGVLFQFDPITLDITKRVDFEGVSKGSSLYAGLVLATDGMLYGVCSKGGSNNKGTLFQYNYVTNAFVKKIDFDSLNGYDPKAGLLEATDGMLYGTTQRGGTDNKGTLFQYNPNTEMYIKKKDFSDIDGQASFAELLQTTDGKIYGTTAQGGFYGYGTFFQYDILNNTLVKKVDFNGTSNGQYPISHLAEAVDGKIYGLTMYGGTNDKGVLFQYDPSNNTCNKKVDFYGTNGSMPSAGLMEASNGMIYGTTFFGGVNSNGVLFQYNPTLSIYTKKFDFTASSGASSASTLIEIFPLLDLIKTGEQKSFSVFPNPITEHFTIQTNDLVSHYIVEIFDATGRKLLVTNFNGKSCELNVGLLEKGIYFIKISDKTTTKSSVRKIVKE